MSLSLILALSSASFAVALAVVVGLDRRRSLARCVFMGGMLVLAAESLLARSSVVATPLATAPDWQQLRLIGLAFVPGTWMLFSLVYSRGNARKMFPKWWPISAAAIVVPPLFAFLFRNDLTDQRPHVPTLGLAGIPLFLYLLIGAVLVLMNLESTYRTAVGTMRWRIKFMVVGLALVFAVRLYTSSQILLFHRIDPAWDDVNSGGLLLGCALILRSVLRTGCFDVDVYPSRSSWRGSFTVVLAGMYLLIVGVFAQVVSLLGGVESFTLKAFLILLALVGLAVLLLSDRVRLRTRTFISRHFQRPFYDYRKVWRSFTAGTASCAEPAELCHSVIQVLADIFQVLSITIWLVDERNGRLRFGASTSFTETKIADLALPRAGVTGLIQALRAHPDPVDIDSSRELWAGLLRGSHPDIFRKGGHRICVPIIAAGEVLGFILLGDRVGGVEFSLQDFDLLKCIAGQVAANLLNVQLSQKLLETKELEAFQTMSAFFVHDLKNTASTLNLMLQNLPVHFSDPAFREDALRGVAKTVTHINHLIGRLSTLRQAVTVQRANVDLHDPIAKLVAEWENAAGIQVVKDLQPLPPVAIDQEQILKVVTNLLVNAREATPGNGAIRISTRPNAGWIVLTVADTGCGMSPEFLNQSLFRPFQTTKKNGIGIGMFQSRMIVEAHGGRIEVESEPGQGTTFQVYLPVQTRNP